MTRFCCNTTTVYTHSTAGCCFLLICLPGVTEAWRGAVRTLLYHPLTTGHANRRPPTAAPVPQHTTYSARATDALRCRGFTGITAQDGQPLLYTASSCHHRGPSPASASRHLSHRRRHSSYSLSLDGSRAFLISPLPHLSLLVSPASLVPVRFRSTLFWPFVWQQPPHARHLPHRFARDRRATR